MSRRPKAQNPGYCDNCGVEIPLERRFCSEECANSWRARAGRLSRRAWPIVVRSVCSEDPERSAALMKTAIYLAESDARPAPEGLFAQPARDEGEKE